MGPASHQAVTVIAEHETEAAAHDGACVEVAAIESLHVQRRQRLWVTGLDVRRQRIEPGQ